MYEPRLFKIEDRETCFDVIRAHPLGLLITAGAGGLMANFVPFILAKNDAGQDVLRAHVARPNPQWRELGPGVPTLVVFQGAQTYITPSWYETKRETGKVVPTWNYATVQVSGASRAIDEPDYIRAQITALTKQMEAPRAAPWAVTDAPADFVDAQIRAIVGLEIVIESVHGKFKASQNRNEADQRGVVEGLLHEVDTDNGHAMAEMVRTYAQKSQS
ncbi:FMN-binding negative transcriptional regulator [Methylovirgula sp. 4M-Z18]|uniref:FMN-binding negative transcriptional regulator n=1 Tax=Methylovirgula sp. 4M-Z18 TaxID=2293567 RepID=UPI000E2F071F|nr:FMN-binding negative transcriptional regulator [Methylovirgula sp. 4M-Z18]RFB80071.1 FMN-binding negative transcriptional regulator [Methylovirgula sp. 4M-Z18]